jgi:hypothetical protein
MDIIEQLARIFTSGWLRRLWTLQEGALAESLYFQFADCAASLDISNQQLEMTLNDLRHRIFTFDFIDEYSRLHSFYHSDRLSHISKPEPFILNTALQYLSVSVSSEESLCLACLMSLSTEALLEKDAEVNDRMMIFWKLVAEKEGGIPSAILFLEETGLSTPGWRWAPASLLTVKPQLQSFDTRILRWRGKDRGEPTSNGLKVKLPGYRVSLGKLNDNRPGHPWKGVPRLPESNLFCRDVDSGEWYLIVHKKYPLMTQEARDAYSALNEFPLAKLMISGRLLYRSGNGLRSRSSRGYPWSTCPSYRAHVGEGGPGWYPSQNSASHYIHPGKSLPDNIPECC